LAPGYDIGAAVCQVAGLVAVGANTVAVLAGLVAVVEADTRVVFVIADDAGAPGDIALFDVDT
jgi:hypothetical protein